MLVPVHTPVLPGDVAEPANRTDAEQRAFVSGGSRSTRDWDKTPELFNRFGVEGWEMVTVTPSERCRCGGPVVARGLQATAVGVNSPGPGGEPTLRRNRGIRFHDPPSQEE